MCGSRLYNCAGEAGRRHGPSMCIDSAQGPAIGEQWTRGPSGLGHRRFEHHRLVALAANRMPK